MTNPAPRAEGTGDQPTTARVMKKMYDRAVSTSVVPRTHEEIRRFFDGWVVLGLVPGFGG